MFDGFQNQMKNLEKLVSSVIFAVCYIERMSKSADEDLMYRIR